MFERYTEKARRVIFFARYEASQFGSPYIETEHLLLGLLREDKALTNRLLRSHASVESIRKQIEGHTTIREKVSTSVDLPLSNECKRVLAYAAEEAERLSHKHIGTEHLLLGLLREEKCFAAEILHQRGLSLSTVREELARSPLPKDQPMPPGPGEMAGRGSATEQKPSPSQLLFEQYKLLVDYRKYLGDQLLKTTAGIVGIPTVLIGLLSAKSQVTVKLALGLGAIVFILLAFVVDRLRRAEDKFVVAMHAIEDSLALRDYKLTKWPSETNNVGARRALAAFLGVIGCVFLGYFFYDLWFR